MQRFKNLLPGTWFAPVKDDNDVLMKLDTAVITHNGEVYNCVNMQGELQWVKPELEVTLSINFDPALIELHQEDDLPVVPGAFIETVQVLKLPDWVIAPLAAIH